MMRTISDVPYLKKHQIWYIEGKEKTNLIKEYISYAKQFGLPLQKVAFMKDKILLHKTWHNSLNGKINKNKIEILENSTKSYLGQNRIDIDFIINNWDKEIIPTNWNKIKRYIYQITNGATEYVIDELLSSEVNNGGAITIKDVFEKAFFINDNVIKLGENIDCTSSLLKSLI